MTGDLPSIVSACKVHPGMAIARASRSTLVKLVSSSSSWSMGALLLIIGLLWPPLSICIHACQASLAP